MKHKRMSSPVLFLMFVFVTLLSIGACASQEPSPTYVCQTPSNTIVAAISDSLNEVSGTRLRNAQMVVSDDFAGAAFVAGEIEGPAMDGDDQIGVWLVGGSGTSGPIYYANGFAHQFSDWGSDLPAKTTPSDHGLKESIQCVKDSLG